MSGETVCLHLLESKEFTLIKFTCSSAGSSGHSVHLNIQFDCSDRSGTRICHFTNHRWLITASLWNHCEIATSSPLQFHRYEFTVSIWATFQIIMTNNNRSKIGFYQFIVWICQRRCLCEDSFKNWVFKSNLPYMRLLIEKSCSDSWYTNTKLSKLHWLVCENSDFKLGIYRVHRWSSMVR